MVTKSLALTQRQLRAICEAAKKSGLTAVLDFGNVSVRLVPEEHALRQQDDQPIDDQTNPANLLSLDEWDVWRERKRAREAQRRS